MVAAANKKGTAPTVPGFPEIVSYQYRCRLCRLARDEHPGIARIVHDLRKKDGLGDRPLAAAAADLLEKHGIKAIDRRCFERHFADHVDFSAVPEVISQAFGIPDEVAMLAHLDEDEAALTREAAEAGALGEDYSDYRRMNDLFMRLHRRIKAIDGDPTAFLSPNGSSNGYKLVMWTTLVREARQTLEGLNKMRNNDRLVMDLLQGHTKRYSILLVDALKQEMLGHIAALREGGDPVAVADAIESFMRRGVVALFKTAAVDSLEQSREEFNLH